MSGWIKFEKSIETDPRALRMTRSLAVTHERFNSPFAVTLVVGALARLWCYADTHARDDDTLDLEPGELDDWLGIAGFCQAMPGDWLIVTDDNRVKLPNFHAHNGVEAKKRALTAKRVERHRGEKKRESVTPCNASALPDQTRPDQKRPEEEKRDLSTSSTVVPLPPTDVDRVFDHWRATWNHPRAVLDGKRRKAILAALKGYSADLLIEAISGYRASPHHTGQNDRGTVYDEISLFLRDAQHIDAGLRFASQAPRTDLSKLTRRNVAAIEDWTPPEARNATG